MKSKARTLFDKIWDAHIVQKKEGFPDVIYIDAHFIHEVTSPQAFNGLKERNIPVFRKDQTFATADHNVPTVDQHKPIKEELSRKQVAMLEHNCKDFGVSLYDLSHPYQGIVHVIGPELGITKPGMTIVCGDSHTSTHGAFGCVAFGIGTSEVEQVLATQCIIQTQPKKMLVQIDGKLNQHVTAKDVILYIISQISASGGTGYFVEYAGSLIESLSMEERMTICNMSIEMGARGGLIAPDDTTFAYMQGKKFMTSGQEWEQSLAYWKTLFSDEDAVFDKKLYYKAESIKPMITYGTNPGMGIAIDEHIPSLNDIEHDEKASFLKSLKYMGLEPNQAIVGKTIQHVFIGSCTNSRIEDLRAVAQFIKNKKKNPAVTAWVVPGSKQVLQQVKAEKLDVIFKEAGFDLREAGCSACLGMNEDKIPPYHYCVSTSNRNFEGRQGPNARTFLASPLTAAAAAIYGKVVDVRTC